LDPQGRGYVLNKSRNMSGEKCLVLLTDCQMNNGRPILIKVMYYNDCGHERLNFIPIGQSPVGG